MKKVLGILFITIFPFNSLAEKFIPLELWLGIEQKNINKIEYLDVDNEFSNGSKKIVGPIFWKNPINKNIIKVYERIHQKQGKKQLFAIFSSKQNWRKINKQVFRRSYDFLSVTGRFLVKSYCL